MKAEIKAFLQYIINLVSQLNNQNFSYNHNDSNSFELFCISITK